MAEIDVLTLTEAKPSGQKIQTPSSWDELKPNTSLLHESIRAFRANQRQGNSSTKTRADVRGGGHKPWKQKGTGRARAGTIRSPLWRKGGIIFGPHPRDYSIEIPKTKRRMALEHALADSVKDSISFIREEELVNTQKTKDLASKIQTFYSALGRPKGSVLIVVSSCPVNFHRASRNLANVAVVSANQLNTYQVISASKVMMTDKAWAKYMEARTHVS